MSRLLCPVLLLCLSSPPLLASDVVAPGHRTRVLRTWSDTVKEDGRDVARRVQIVFDYDDVVAFEVVFSEPDGRLLSTRKLEGAPPRPSPEEITEAFEIVRADAQLGEIVRRTGGILEGGFVLEGGMSPCGPGTRCLEVQILDRGRYAAIRKVVVDVVTQQIVVRALFPAPEQVAGATPTSEEGAR